MLRMRVIGQGGARAPGAAYGQLRRGYARPLNTAGRLPFMPGLRSRQAAGGVIGRRPVMSNTPATLPALAMMPERARPGHCLAGSLCAASLHALPDAWARTGRQPEAMAIWSR